MRRLREAVFFCLMVLVVSCGESDSEQRNRIVKEERARVEANLKMALGKNPQAIDADGFDWWESYTAVNQRFLRENPEATFFYTSTGLGFDLEYSGEKLIMSFGLGYDDMYCRLECPPLLAEKVLNGKRSRDTRWLVVFKLSDTRRMALELTADIDYDLGQPFGYVFVDETTSVMIGFGEVLSVEQIGGE